MSECVSAQVTTPSGSTQLIVYACPTGLLAEQLDLYFEKSLSLCGANTAHAYMPHCTLTGFFTDAPAAIPLYCLALQAVLDDARPAQPQPVFTIFTIQGITFRPDWHGLELESDWIQRLIARFAEQADSPTRRNPLRLKDWLHLSLAYGFAPDQGDRLQVLAQQLVNPDAPVGWDLRLYERCPDQSWICHYSQTLSVA